MTVLKALHAITDFVELWRNVGWVPAVGIDIFDHNLGDHGDMVARGWTGIKTAAAVNAA